MDVDLEKFFDRINHDILIDRLQKRIGDVGMVRLIRAYLNSGIMSCRVSCDHIPIRSWPLFKARDLLQSLIDDCRHQKKSDTG